MHSKAGLLDPVREGRVSLLATGVLIARLSSVSAYTDHMWIKGKENQLAGLTKLKAVN